jgi:hypothetical protein
MNLGCVSENTTDKEIGTGSNFFKPVNPLLLLDFTEVYVAPFQQTMP